MSNKSMLILLSIIVAFTGVSQSALIVSNPWLLRANCTNQYQYNYLPVEATTWLHARERCRAQGADLISINDKEELAWVNHFLSNNVVHLDVNYLIGLYKHSNTQQWVMVDNSTLDGNLLKWNPGQPSGLERCAVFNILKQRLSDVNCLYQHPKTLTRYICERNQDQTSLVVGQTKHNAKKPEPEEKEEKSRPKQTASGTGTGTDKGDNLVETPWYNVTLPPLVIGGGKR